MKIEDGRGRGFSATVNPEQELVVRAVSEPEIEHASFITGSAYSWFSGNRDIDAGDTMLMVKNTGDTPLILDRAYLTGSNVICTWSVRIGSSTTDPSGTSITPVNLNEGFAAQPAEAVAFADETALPDGALLGEFVTSVQVTSEANFAGVILGKGHYIQFNQDTESTSGSISLVAHYATPS